MALWIAFALDLLSSLTSIGHWHNDLAWSIINLEVLSYAYVDRRCTTGLDNVL